MTDKLKTRFFALAASVAALLGTSAQAQELPAGSDPRSGDAWVDVWLGDISRYATRYREPFVDEMVRYYGAPRELVGDLLDQRRWTPGDVYYACAIAQVLGRPCRYVVDEWDREHGQGWGEVAQRLGVKPGSAEFHRLKRGFVPTYDRWGRPITIDTELHRDFPNRPYRDYPSPKAPAAAKADKGKDEKGKAEKGKAEAAKAKGAAGKSRAAAEGTAKRQGKPASGAAKRD
ncbi:hypothetical protein AZ78_4031 [Lysobacter capsici AZ78]|uniref:Uncharacterized protein n=1 Tax=Lysobacter capsici AZ78 TaxID=1444315 RepID=A0A108UCA4_9GAMM|nr:hypothetical protein [Lysobacter capsici]KWS06475.1 hypothetical protein AZ78_4031 [Lysobacter capsici AZ78]